MRGNCKLSSKNPCGSNRCSLKRSVLGSISACKAIGGYNSNIDMTEECEEDDMFQENVFEKLFIVSSYIVYVMLYVLFILCDTLIRMFCQVIDYRHFNARYC